MRVREGERGKRAGGASIYQRRREVGGSMRRIAPYGRSLINSGRRQSRIRAAEYDDCCNRRAAPCRAAPHRIAPSLSPLPSLPFIPSSSFRYTNEDIRGNSSLADRCETSTHSYPTRPTGNGKICFPFAGASRELSSWLSSRLKF